MSRSKKLFLAVAVIFFLAILYVMYDMSSRTTFPGSKPNEEMMERDLPDTQEVNETDTMDIDSTSM